MKEPQVRVLDTVRAMSDSKLQRKVAELHGYKVVNDGSGGEYPWHLVRPNGIQHNGWKFERSAWTHGLPDYPRDLNAMQAAYEILDPEERIDFARHLDFDDDLWGHLAIAATARQRAEAFVLTLSGSNTGTSGEEKQGEASH